MVMTTKFLKSLEAEIEKCKNRLTELEPLIYENTEAAENYNRILVKKAILVDKYKKILNKKSAISKFFKIFKLKKESKLICDYFQDV